MSQRLSLILIPFFVFFALFYRALEVLEISLLHAELAALAGALFVLCLALGVLMAVAKDRLRTAFLAVMTFIVLDISADGGERLSFIANLSHSKTGQQALRVLAILAVIAILYAMLWKIREHAPKILTAVFGVMFATTMAFSSPSFDARTSTVRVSERKATEDRAALPVWIHLFFDELVAPEAINREIKRGQHLYDSTRNFYLRHNFRLYGQAYSRFRATFRSMSAMMNFDSSSLEPLAKYADGTERPKFMHANAYFRQAAEAGYDVHVFQTRHFDFCNSPAVTRCETLNSYSPISRFVSFPEKNLLYRTANLLAMMVTIFNKSNSSRITSSVLNKVGGFGNWFDAESFPLWFEHLMHKVVEAPRGTMIFAHFLVPHAPYALGQDCELKGRIPPHYREDKTPRDEETWPAFRARYQERYYEQTLCIYRYLETLLSALEASGRFHDAVIIVHGDHGSRITRSDYAEYMSTEDLVANYATLFAIRKPGLAGGYDLEFVSMQELFTRHVLSPGAQNISLGSPVVKNAGPLDKAAAAASATEPRKHSVVVRKAKTGELEEAAMPGFSEPYSPVRRGSEPR